LRNLDTETLLNASIETYSGDVSNNIGDCWLPVVDGDFLPDSPSNLVAQHRMANVTAIIGWADDDLGFFTPRTITTDNDTQDFITSYLPDMNSTSVTELLSIYPVTDFSDNPSANLSANFYRSSRIFRDVLMTCMPSWMGGHLAAMGASVFLYDQNATVLTPLLEDLGSTGLGPVHTSEFAYVFGNLSHYNLTDDDLPGFDPTEEDFELAKRQTRSWSSFIAVGQPSLLSKETLQGWELAFAKGNGTGEEWDPMSTEQTKVYVVGGGQPGTSSVEGDGATNAKLAAQKLRERCAFLNSEDVIRQLQF
jgi:carboxylesterase type B